MTTLNALGIVADPDFVRDEREAASLDPATHPTPHLAPLDCGVCFRRTGESSIVIRGRVTAICGTCSERLTEATA